MNGSLDTDIVIHLYISDKKDLLFSSFKELYMYEYLVEVELKNKAPLIYKELKKNTDENKIKIITKENLHKIGMKDSFDEYVRDYKDLFDQGEMYAIALAKTIGIMALVSDDTKDFGPHDSLRREMIKDVIPFAFYELLFLKYIHSKLSVEELYSEFEIVSNKLSYPMRFISRITRTIRRFSSRGTKRDQNWIRQYCKEHNINYNKKMIELRDYLKENF